MARKKKKPVDKMGINQKDILSEKQASDLENVRQDPSDISVDEGRITTDKVDNSLLPTGKQPSNSNLIHLKEVSTVLKPSGYGSSSAGGMAVKSVTFSGNDALIVGGASQTTRSEGGQQRDSRFLRKDETTIHNLDDVTSAQTYITTKGPRDLSQNPDAVQGSDGKNVPTPVLIQKRSGYVPHERQFNASVDIIDRDEIVYVDKQVVYPTLTPDPDTTPPVNYSFDSNDKIVETPYHNPRGNYIPRELRVRFSELGQVTDFTVVSDDNTIYSVGDDVANLSSPAALTHRNLVEACRQSIYKNAGDPKSDKFSPLGRKIHYPNGVLSMYKDYEAMTGAEVMMSIRSLAHALSFQINKAAKDGQTPQDAVMDMAYGSIASLLTESEALRSLVAGESPAFNPPLMRIGSPNILINAFDTVRKYSTRGDMLTIRKSYRSFLEAAKNHCASFRYPEDLLTYINNRHVFSTISHEYDEQMPVYMTGFTALAHPRDFNTCFNVQNGVVRGRYLLHYHDDIDSSFTYMTLPLLEGIYNYIVKNSRKIFSVLDSGSDKTNWSQREWIIPIFHSYEYITLWDLLVCAATTDIEYSRQESFREFLDYEANFGPIFPTHKNISFEEIVQAKNYKYTDYTEPLTVGRMNDYTAASWVMPELFIPLMEDDRILGSERYSMLLPYTYSEASYDYRGCLDVDSLAIGFPLVRNGVNIGLLDNIVNMDEREFRLSLDIPTDLPRSYIGDDLIQIDYYKYSILTHGCLAATAKSHPTVGQICDLPRELGLGFVPPQYYLRRVINILDHSRFGWYSARDDQFNGIPSYTATVWFADEEASDGILQGSVRNNARGANFYQIWNRIVISRDPESGASDSSGRICLSRNALLTGATGAIRANGSKFKPFIKDADNEENVMPFNYLLNLNKADYFIEQYLDFLINPFDISGIPDLDGTNSLMTDPFERLYRYGFLGFIASNYTEDARNRINMMDIAGQSYLEDYYRDATPLLK